MEGKRSGGKKAHDCGRGSKLSKEGRMSYNGVKKMPNAMQTVERIVYRYSRPIVVHPMVVHECMQQ